MNEFVLRPGDIFTLLKRHRKPVLLTLVACIALSVATFLIFPRTYEVQAILHIGVNYFQDPLTNDMVGQTHDAGELRSERSRILRESLGVDFANQAGDKFSLFSSRPGDASRNLEVEEFLKGIEIIDASATQFLIKIRAPTADAAHGIMMLAIDTVRQQMYRKRIALLEQVLSVLSNEIFASEQSPRRNTTSQSALAMSVGRGAGTSAARLQVTARLDFLRRQLEELLRSYNEQHPSVQALRTEMAELEGSLRGGAGLTRQQVFPATGSSSTSIVDSLSKQKHLINMALEMERKDPSMRNYLSLIREPIYPKRPISPKLRYFALGAITLSLLAAVIAGAFAELLQQSRVSIATLAEHLGTEVVGTLSLARARSELK